jgi:type VI secretion system protein ImpK
MPTIVRAAPAQPPKPAPAGVQDGPLERLRAFLRPEIEANQVDVSGTEATPVVSVREAGMFASGSATVASASEQLLGRIAAALKPESGPVQVIGYTDDTPIHTVRFPSNFQLSTARADAAAAILAGDTGEPGRISAEGRADADPIASNTTPEGRAANRRIEILLHAQG